MEENPGMAHKIVLNNRNQGNLTGILDVISFDENTIVLDTDMGLLTIKGKDLPHVNLPQATAPDAKMRRRTFSFIYMMGIKIYAHRQRSPGRLFPGHKENLTDLSP